MTQSGATQGAAEFAADSAALVEQARVIAMGALKSVEAAHRTVVFSQKRIKEAHRPLETAAGMISTGKGRGLQLAGACVQADTMTQELIQALATLADSLDRLTKGQKLLHKHIEEWAVELRS